MKYWKYIFKIQINFDLVEKQTLDIPCTHVWAGGDFLVDELIIIHTYKSLLQ